MSYNQILQINKDILYLEHLEKLFFRKIWNLPRLYILVLSNNKITSLSFGNMERNILQYLNIGNNLLCELPDEICKLISLYELQLYNNDLKSLPQNFNIYIKLEIKDLKKIYSLKYIETILI